MVLDLWRDRRNYLIRRGDAMTRGTRVLLCGIFLAAFAGTAAAQLPPQEELQKRLDAKLSQAWIQANPWITDYDAARQKAKETGKPIFAYFTRSYSP
jgi:hypothetical protein